MKIKNPILLFGLICVLALLSLKPLFSKKPTHEKLGEAAQVVQTFCEKDAQGLRLSSKTSAEVRNLTVWEDEPGWDKVVKIKNFKITEEKYLGKHAQVKVLYELVSPSALEKKEVTFLLTQGESSWKINEPQTLPHVYENVVK